MYEKNNYSRPARPWVGRLLDFLDFGWVDFVGLAFVAFILLAILFLSGCSAPGDYFGDKPAVAAANARPGLFGGVTAAAPAVVAGAVKSAGWLNGLGAVLLAGGCFALSQNGVSNSLGFGLALAGVSLLTAGFILPLYAGWVGLALFGALVVWFWGRHRGDVPGGSLAETLPQPPSSLLAAPGLFSRLKSLFA